MSFSIRSLNIDEFHMNLIPNAETELQIVGGPILKQEQKLCEININQLKSQIVTPLVLRNETVINGGQWKPKYCQPKFDSTIIIPYRDREKHLTELLNHLHPFLQAQNLSYRIIVIEQEQGKPFNRAKLFNVGVAESQKIKTGHQCFILHDVDLVPLNAQNLYACSKLPLHLSAYIDTFRYNLPYKNLFGGVIAISEDMYKDINGFSNEYSGWGGEDDDLWVNRISPQTHGVMLRYQSSISKYRMLQHEKASPSADRFQKLKKGNDNYFEDGLNNVEYSVISKVERNLYTHILVTI